MCKMHADDNILCIFSEFSSLLSKTSCEQGIVVMWMLHRHQTLVLKMCHVPCPIVGT